MDVHAGFFLFGLIYVAAVIGAVVGVVLAIVLAVRAMRRSATALERIASALEKRPPG